MVNAGVKLPSFPELVVKAKYATEHRCGVVVSGPGLSDDVSGTDPLKDNLPLQVTSAYSSIFQSIGQLVSQSISQSIHQSGTRGMLFASRGQHW